jgi:hypothetical protein
MIDPYREGFEACLLWLEGEHPRCNPYMGGEDAYEWDVGWADASDAVVETARGRFLVRRAEETIPQIVRRLGRANPQA